MCTNNQPTTSSRKPYNNRAGYLSSLRSGAGRGWVVIYDAAAAGLDATGGRYAIACETHHTLTNAKSMPAARSSMKAVDFCEECTRARVRTAGTGQTAGAAYDAAAAEPLHLAAAPVATAAPEESTAAPVYICQPYAGFCGFPAGGVAAWPSALEKLTAAAAAELELHRSPRLLMLSEGMGNFLLMLAQAAGIRKEHAGSVCTVSASFPAPAMVYSADYSEEQWYAVFKYGGHYFLQGPNRLQNWLQKDDAALLIVQATSAAATGAVTSEPVPLQLEQRQALAEAASSQQPGYGQQRPRYSDLMQLADADLVAAAGFTPILRVAPEALQQLQAEVPEGELSTTHRLRLIEIIYEHTPMRGEGGRWQKDTRGSNSLRLIWEAGRWLELRSCSDSELISRALRLLTKQPAEPAPVATS